ncbi:MAG: hypothetical protein ISS72_05025 [Candidatus Brocadiae bacterium]|nr:hypothetical protein [Candidatus Brocadiia bacterium]
MEMPTLEPCAEFRLQEGEAFAVAGGFEDRAVRFSEMLADPVPGSSAAILLRYLPTDAANRFEEVCSILEGKGLSTAILEYDRHHPATFDTRVLEILDRQAVNALCVDASGMSRLAIMVLLDIARERNMPCRIVYAEAEAYAPSKEEFEAAKALKEQHLPTSFIHTGVYDVIRVPRLSSIRMQNQASVVIAFDSFNEALCQALVNVLNPKRLILINGRPPRDELRWREEATRYVHRRLREEWPVDEAHFAPDEGAPEDELTTSTLRYVETYDMLVKLYWRFSTDHRIILAPTGSKMQTLGAYLLRAVHNDVHVEYPTVEGFFARKYSTGVRQTWQMSLGRMGTFVEKLRQKELREHLELPEELVNIEID